MIGRKIILKPTHLLTVCTERSFNGVQYFEPRLRLKEILKLTKIECWVGLRDSLEKLLIR